MDLQDLTHEQFMKLGARVELRTKEWNKERMRRYRNELAASKRRDRRTKKETI